MISFDKKGRVVRVEPVDILILSIATIAMTVFVVLLLVFGA